MGKFQTLLKTSKRGQRVLRICRLEIIKNSAEYYFQLRLSNHRKMLIKKLCTSLHDKSVCNTRAFNRERKRKCYESVCVAERPVESLGLRILCAFTRTPFHTTPARFRQSHFLLRFRIPIAERCLRTCLRVRLSTKHSAVS